MYEISHKQAEYIRKSTHRWNGKIGATQSGKTYIDTLFVIPQRIVERLGKSGLVFIVGVSRETIKRNIIEPLQELFGSAVGDISSDNTCKMFGEKVYCLGADNKGRVSKFRGPRVKYLYVDELVDISKEVFELLKSRLSFEYSQCDFAGNPQNRNHWAKKFMDSDIDIYLQHYQIFDNPFLPREYVKQLCKEYEGTVYYNRYILGQWCDAEGIIFKRIAEHKEEYITKETKSGIISIGIDWGGHKSKHAICATKINRQFEYIQVLASDTLEADGTDTEKIFKWILTFINKIQKQYGSIEAIFPDCAEQVLNNSLGKYLRDNGEYISILDSVKIPIEERIRLLSILFNIKTITFKEAETDKIIEALQTAVFDETSPTDRWIDDGETSDIDSLDAFCYSWTYWSEQLSNWIGG